MPRYEQVTTAYVDIQDDLLQEMIGYRDPKTKQKVPGIIDRILEKINFKNMASNPDEELNQVVDELIQAYAFYLNQNMIAGREYAKLLRGQQ